MISAGTPALCSVVGELLKNITGQLVELLMRRGESERGLRVGIGPARDEQAQREVALGALGKFAHGDQCRCQVSGARLSM